MTLASQQVFTANSGMPVRVEIITACSVSAPDLDFGAYNTSLTEPVRAQTALQLRCGVGVVVEVSLDGGEGPGGNTSRRTMNQESGPGRLDYGLYQDAARTVNWGDRSGVDTVEVQATGVPQSVPVYGEIPGGQRARAGIYSDTITVRLQY